MSYLSEEYLTNFWPLFLPLGVGRDILEERSGKQWVISGSKLGTYDKIFHVTCHIELCQSYRIVGNFRMVFIFGYFKETFFFENEFLLTALLLK